MSEQPTHVPVERGSVLWLEAWKALASHPLNASCDEPTVCAAAHEVWQFMGAWTGGTYGDRTVAQFRHRCHPLTYRRETLEFDVGTGGER